MDAQIFWDPIGTSSCLHGVTSVVMGNCGFTLAPCRESEADLVMRNLERAEDISRAAMKAGIKWRWETFPEFLDVLESLPKGINYAGYIGHSALRTYVMGERAFTDEATEDDLRAMVHHTREAIAAGAHRLLDHALASATRPRTTSRWRAGSPPGTSSRRWCKAMGARHVRGRRRAARRRRPQGARATTRA